MARVAGARNAQFEERRNALIEKAKERLSLQDGQSPSFRELALAAGVSVATLRHYFGDRESLIKAVFAHYLQSGQRHLEQTRAPDPVSKAYRTNEHFPAEKVDLSANEWRTVRLAFKGDTVAMSVDGQWTRTLQRPNFDATKRKLLWMQNGGAAGIEIDDVVVTPTP